MKNVPAPFLLAVAATLYGVNPLLLIVNKAGEWPFLYGGIGSVGLGSALLIGGLVLQRNQGIRWRVLLSRKMTWKSIYPVLVSRASFPCYAISGAYIHFVIAGVMTSLLPVVQMTAIWFQRRSSELKLPANKKTLLACAIGLVGGLLCAFAQPAQEDVGSLHIFVHPTEAALGLTIALVSMFSAAGQTYVFRFWMDNHEYLMPEKPESYGVDEMGRHVAAVGAVVIGASAVLSGLLFAGYGLVIGQTPVDNVYYLYAYGNGLISGAGMVLWVIGYAKSRTLASSVVLYLEPLSGLVITKVAGVAEDLNWSLLFTSTSLIAVAGIAVAVMEYRQKNRDRKGLLENEVSLRRSTNQLAGVSDESLD